MKLLVIHVLLILFFCSILFSADTTQEYAGREYFVDAVSGDDGNSGSEEDPWQTISMAVGVVKPGDRIWVKPGIYRETVNLIYEGAQSLRSISFCSEEPGAAVVKCSDLLEDWEEYSEGIYRTQVDIPEIRQVFCYGRKCQLSRTPNTGYFRAQSGGLYSLTDSTLTQPDDYWNGSILRFAGRQANFSARVISDFDHDTHTLYWDEELVEISEQMPYYLEGCFSEIDTLGEWFHDTEGGWLYFNSSRFNINNHPVEASARDNAFEIRGSSNIELDGFTIKHGNGSMGVGSGIFLESSSDCRMRNLTVDYAYTDGIFFLDLSNGNEIRDCIIENSGRHGISFYSTTTGPSLNRIENCEIVYSGQEAFDGTGISMVESSWNEIVGNRIHSSSGTAISLTLASTEGNLISGNRVWQNGLRSNDRAAISLWGCGTDNIVEYNYVWETLGWDEHQQSYYGSGIIIDRMSEGVLVQGNVIWDNYGFGIDLYKTSGNTIIQNTSCFNGIKSWHAQIRANGEESVDNVICNNVGYSGSDELSFSVTEGADEITDNIIDGNLWYREEEDTIVRWGSNYYTLEDYQENTGYGENSTDLYPEFVLQEDDDYRIYQNSPCVDGGIYLEGVLYNGDAPDRGAYEFGWQPPMIYDVEEYIFYPGLRSHIEIEAFDPDGDDLVFSAENLPGRASLDEDTGEITWLPRLLNLGSTYNVQVHVTDGMSSDSSDVVFRVKVPVMDPKVTISDYQ